MPNSKTIWELFNEKYPIDKCKDNPFICCEAIGFLKALSDFSPALRVECKKRIELYLMLVGMTILEDVLNEIYNQKDND